MATQRNVPYAPAAQAPRTTGKVAHCAVCDCQWQVRSFANTDAMGCAFCGAPEKAISIHDESKRYGKARHDI